MKIVVSADHVRAGEIGSCLDCPIGHALRDALPGVEFEVGTIAIHIRRGVDWIAHPLPWFVTRFIQAFDAGVDVAPIEFDLPIDPDLDPDPTNTPAALAA